MPSAVAFYSKRALIIAGVLLALLGINYLVNLVPTLGYYKHVLNNCGIAVIATVSLNLVTGFTGQFSLGHAGFMAIGAYTSASFVVFLGPFSPPLSMFLGMLTGGICAAISGFIVGLPTLRLRGDYLAIATLGFSEIIRVSILNIQKVGGARGFIGIPETANIFWIWGAAILTVVVIANLVYSPRGSAFLAIREDEIAAGAMGIQTTKYKVAAFVVSAFFAGMAGSLFAHHNAYLNPASFDFLKSVEVVLMVVLGGLGSITGSVIAAVIVTASLEVLRGFAEWRLVIYAVLLILMMIVRPQGLFGSKELFSSTDRRMLKGVWREREEEEEKEEIIT
ncbi:MAG TPA: branched-chain amino acid ABC transporter permease [Bdellovibrionota bacterium]|nr:branched-chain amino acid ABC transporter permease [Bdellovibrionota bacterium]